MWKSVLELNRERSITDGSEAVLADAIRNGADLRIYTEFRYNEHIDTTSTNDELVQEVSEFGVTYLLQDFWVAGIMSLRQPILPPDSFGPRPSMSFFLYNQNGQQAIARPYLDAQPRPGVLGACSPVTQTNMPKYHAHDAFDTQTNAPSSNFIYDFESFRFCVHDSWREVFAHDENGKTTFGSLDDLVTAFAEGCEVKIAIRNFVGEKSQAKTQIEQELFIQLGPCYYNTKSRIFSAGSHPIVRVAPQIPLRYESGNWDFGWLLLRSDGGVEYRRCDPYSLQFQDVQSRHALRWFVR